MTGVTKKIYCTVMLCNNLLMSTNISRNFDDSIKSDNNQINTDLSKLRIQSVQPEISRTKKGFILLLQLSLYQPEKSFQIFLK